MQVLPSKRVWRALMHSTERQRFIGYPLRPHPATLSGIQVSLIPTFWIKLSVPLFPLLLSKDEPALQGILSRVCWTYWRQQTRSHLP